MPTWEPGVPLKVMKVCGAVQPLFVPPSWPMQAEFTDRTLKSFAPPTTSDVPGMSIARELERSESFVLSVAQLEGVYQSAIESEGVNCRKVIPHAVAPS